MILEVNRYNQHRKKETLNAHNNIVIKVINQFYRQLFGKLITFSQMQISILKVFSNNQIKNNVM